MAKKVIIVCDLQGVGCHSKKAIKLQPQGVGVSLIKADDLAKLDAHKKGWKSNLGSSYCPNCWKYVK